jgi:chitinase
MHITSRLTAAIAVGGWWFATPVVVASQLESWLAKHPISTTTLVVSVAEPTAIPPTAKVRNIVLSNPGAFQRCPVKCSESGSSPGNWTAYHSTQCLSQCNETMILDFNVYTPVNSSQAHTTFRSCVADLQPNSPVSVRSDDTLVANTNTQTKKVQAPLQAGWTNSKTTTPVAQVVDVVQQIQYQMSHGQSANKTTLFGYSWVFISDPE